MESSRGIYQDSEGISFADIALRHQDGRWKDLILEVFAGICADSDSRTYPHGYRQFRRCRGRTRACLRGWIVGLSGVAVVEGPRARG